MSAFEDKQFDYLVTDFRKIQDLQIEQDVVLYQGYELWAGALIHHNLPSVIESLVAEYAGQVVARIVIDSDQRCCEDFGTYLELNGMRIDFEGEDATSVARSNLVRRLLTANSVEWCPERLKREDNDGSGRYTHEAGILIRGYSLDKESISNITVVLFNNHNGYYSHDIILQRHGHNDCQTL